MSDRVITAELLERLRRHYIKPGPMPGWTFVPECGINGGVQTRADALAIGFTSTSGRILIGHELKASRADWRKELDTAGKADFWADNCHAWYIVAPSTDIVPKEEVPHGWGLMVPNARTKTRMDVLIKAPVHPDRTPSWDAVRSIFARLDTLRAQDERRIIDKAVQTARQEAESREAAARLRGERTTLTRDHERRLELLDRIEQAMGGPVDYVGRDGRVRPEHAAAALRLVLAADQMLLQNDRYATQHLRQSAQAVLDGVEDFTAAREAFAAITQPNLKKGA